MGKVERLGKYIRDEMNREKKEEKRRYGCEKVFLGGLF